MTEPVNPNKAIIFVSVEGLPDAYAANKSEIELRVTQPDSPVEAVIVIPLTQARVWAAEVYTAVMTAYRDHTSDPTPLTDHDLTAMPEWCSNTTPNGDPLWD